MVWNPKSLDSQRQKKSIYSTELLHFVFPPPPTRYDIYRTTLQELCGLFIFEVNQYGAHNGARNTSGPPDWLSYNIRFKVRSSSSCRWAKVLNNPVPSTNVALASIFHPPALFDAARDGLLQDWDLRDQKSLSYFVCSARKQNWKIKCSLSARKQMVFTCRSIMLEVDSLPNCQPSE